MTDQLALPDGPLGVACVALVPVIYRGSRHIDGTSLATWADLYESDQHITKGKP